ncbi:MAG: hypothetical protein K5984_04115 [Bacteroidales bacterium]|nr:hypothetical protein [Bacteroidales bacterium]
MKKSFALAYALLLIGQLLICNYFHFTPYLVLTMLPTMVLCIPSKHDTSVALVVAFVSGLLVDFLAEGVIGLNVTALVPVAFCRKWIIEKVFGEDLFSRGDDFSIKRYGLGKVAMAIILATSLYLIIYIAADGAGIRPFWFNTLRFFGSLVISFVLSICVADLLNPDDRK